MPIAQSVIANTHLQITQRFEMIDTITGTPMGASPASAGGSGAFHQGNHHVLKHNYTGKNVAGAAIANVRLFQLLHGMNSQRGDYDNRSIPEPFPISNSTRHSPAWTHGPPEPALDWSISSAFMPLPRLRRMRSASVASMKTAWRFIIPPVADG